MNRRNSYSQEDIKMDMTPMIDVIFNLIIFFMLVTQMVTVERAELIMPIADEAIEEKTGDKEGLVINIHKDAQIEVSGRIISWQELNKLLFEESKISSDENGLPTRSVVIRADIKAPYKSVQQVMMECTKNKIYKVSFGAKIDKN